ncbi:hypothetical protein [Streptomyces albogriseolus]|uniref:hypothetical protein n=1 Tax=Streptomyces albogriseolus TaxID=1887 RepID=UPI003CF0D804
MNGPEVVHAWPLTVRLYLAAWRSSSGRFGASRIRTHSGGAPHTIGVMLTVLGGTLALGQFGKAPGTTRTWFRDWGRWSVGGWRTRRTVPVSAGFVYGGPPRPGSRRPGDVRIGVLVTLASRTLCLYRLEKARHRRRR